MTKRKKGDTKGPFAYWCRRNEKGVYIREKGISPIAIKN
jgi:hypothetical protein